MVKNIGVIGVGAIAEAIVVGLSEATPETKIHLSPRNAEAAAALAADHEHVTVCDDNQAVVDRSEVLLLAVRPDAVESVLDALEVPTDRTVISAVAGWSIASLLQRLPHGPDVVRVIPLQAVRERRGVTAMYPPHQVAEEIFGPLGRTVAPSSEAQFSAMSAATATASTHLTYLATIAGWLTEQGLPAADADSFMRAMYAEIGASLTADAAPLPDLVRGHETPGGLNEAVREGWFDDAHQARLRQILDQVLQRVSPPPS